VGNGEEDSRQHVLEIFNMTFQLGQVCVQGGFVIIWEYLQPQQCGHCFFWVDFFPAIALVALLVDKIFLPEPVPICMKFGLG
jgi:hypothetical protein